MFPPTSSENQFMNLIFCRRSNDIGRWARVGRYRVSCWKNYLVETTSSFIFFIDFTNTAWYLHNYCFAKSVSPMSRWGLNYHFVLFVSVFGLAFPQYGMRSWKASGKCTPPTVTLYMYAFCHTVYCTYLLCTVLSNKHRLFSWTAWTDFFFYWRLQLYSLRGRY